MIDKIHNLDEDVSEYFEFILFGKKYKFRYMTSDELTELKDIGDKKGSSEKEVLSYIYKFIGKGEEAAPDFVEVSSKMTIAHLKKFLIMVRTEFGINEQS